MDTTIRKKVKEAIKTLSEERYRVVLDFINYLGDWEAWESTGEIL